MSVLGVEDLSRLMFLDNHDKNSVSMFRNLYRTSKSLHSDKTVASLEKTHSEFWAMKRCIADVVALRNTTALEMFVKSEKGQTFSCVHVIGALTDLQSKQGYFCPAAEQLAQAVQSVCTILIQRNDTLIQSDVEKYAQFNDIAIDIVNSIGSLLHVPFFVGWNCMTPIQYTATFLHNRPEMSRVVFTTELFNGLLQLCKRHKHNLNIAILLLELVATMTIQGDPSTMKRLLTMPMHITSIQEFVQTTLSNQGIEHRYLTEIEDNCVCYMKYLFQGGLACSVSEETNVCLRIIKFMHTKCVGFYTQGMYLELLLHRTKTATLKNLREGGAMEHLSSCILPRNSDIFVRIGKRYSETLIRN